MRRAQRLFRLVNDMRSRDVVRAEDLAVHFEVSLSTIYRDIAHLQASGLPIDGAAGVGYVMRRGFDLPNVAFTNDQIDALAIGLSFVEKTGDPDLMTAAREARAKIQAGMPDPKDRKLADAPYYSLQAKAGAPPSVGLVRDAIRQMLVTEITYQDGQGAESTREIYPLVVWDLSDGWMVSAWCTLRQNFRTFRFDRITSIQVSDRHFPVDTDKSLEAFLEADRCHD
ncbi:MAG: YafY family transcriptional regulator [Marinovum sp.]|nr:YafY family transcriptional regulator [Marinovum sp.]